MKKVCVTSVVSLLLVFLLVFAGCEQPVSAGLKDDGSVTVEGNAVTGEMQLPDKTILLEK